MFTITPYDSYCSYKTINQKIESYPKTFTWNTSSNCCSWAGVYCYETTGQMIELALVAANFKVSFIPTVASFNYPLSKGLICLIMISLGRTFHLNLVSFLA
ncbi:hypothetical protein H5410_001389 [Solanum commersonii]|uniref:Leucine-rich repeat-containing N-terminal plant-type domain-containing protein n=1 Tax=Solanum commersonii TaxID=4109 RepID=A0A9J6AYW0_SOLCO|nr:hypothetical protein H5410_001389 [Solanum commersonii]